MNLSKRGLLPTLSLCNLYPLSLSLSLFRPSASLFDLSPRNTSVHTLYCHKAKTVLTEKHLHIELLSYYTQYRLQKRRSLGVGLVGVVGDEEGLTGSAVDTRITGVFSDRGQ